MAKQQNREKKKIERHGSNTNWNNPIWLSKWKSIGKGKKIGEGKALTGTNNAFQQVDHGLSTSLKIYSLKIAYATN